MSDRLIFTSGLPELKGIVGFSGLDKKINSLSNIFFGENSQMTVIWQGFASMALSQVYLADTVVPPSSAVVVMYLSRPNLPGLLHWF